MIDDFAQEGDTVIGLGIGYKDEGKLLKGFVVNHHILNNCIFVEYDNPSMSRNFEGFIINDFDKETARCRLLLTEKCNAII